jgi:hypothetical protein
MNQSWKPILYEYIRTRNESAVEYDASLISPFLKDEAYLRLQQRFLSRQKQWHADRKIKPVNQETRARIVRLEENEASIKADLEYRRIFQYELKGRPYHEERVEKERVHIKDENGKWVIAGVKTAVPEYSLPDSRIIRAQQQPYRYPAVPQYPYPDGGAPGQYPSIPFVSPFVYTQNQYTYRGIPYNRAKVRAYADRWWNGGNPEFLNFDVDCTNFISQCLYAGSAPMNYTDRRATGWWYKGRVNGQELWSFSWAVAHSLQFYLAASRSSGLRAQVMNRPEDLTIGDVIIYDFDGDGRYQHSTIVTEKDARGMPLVNAHTSNSYKRYWDYQDSYAWSDNTRYRFFHIADEF